MVLAGPPGAAVAKREFGSLGPVVPERVEIPGPVGTGSGAAASQGGS